MKKIFMLSAALPILAMAQVGINTTTPAATLDVQTKGNTETTKSLRIVNSDGKENVTVLDNGNVGIGTANPTSKVEVHNGFVKIINVNDWSGMYNYVYSNNPNHYGFNLSLRARGDISNITYPKVGDQLGGLMARDAIDGRNASKYGGGAISFTATEDFTENKKGTDIKFFTTDNGSADINFKMILSDKGNLGINNPTPQTKLDIYSPTEGTAIKIVDGSQGAGKVLTSDANGVGTWTRPSGKIIIGSYSRNPYTSMSIYHDSQLDQPTYTGLSITLEPGIYKVNARCGFARQNKYSWRYIAYSKDSPSTPKIGMQFVGGESIYPMPTNPELGYSEVKVASTDWVIDLSNATSETIIYILQSDTIDSTATAPPNSDEFSVSAIRI